jgi:hypothetical protein
VKRFKGPELKLSELKVPPMARDLYLDLRDRRLLPLVGLVLVAILATPFLLGGGGETIEPVPVPSVRGSAREATLAVLPAEPGLREPSKRLAGQPSKNPFRPHYTAPVFNKGAAPTAETTTGGGTVTSSTETAPEASSGGGGSSSPAPEPTPAPESSGGGGSGHSGNSSSGSLPGEIQLYSFGIDVKIAHTEATDSGATKMGDPETREGVKPASPLPGKKAPVLTYLGVDTTGKKALMLVSSEATSLFGDNKCLSGLSTCQLIALEEKMPEVVVFGSNEARYRFELLKIEPIKGPKIKAPQE